MLSQYSALSTFAASNGISLVSLVLSKICCVLLLTGGFYCEGVIGNETRLSLKCRSHFVCSDSSIPATPDWRRLETWEWDCKLLSPAGHNKECRFKALLHWLHYLYSLCFLACWANGSGTNLLTTLEMAGKVTAVCVSIYWPKLTERSSELSAQLLTLQEEVSRSAQPRSCVITTVGKCRIEMHRKLLCKTLLLFLVWVWCWPSIYI